LVCQRNFLADYQSKSDQLHSPEGGTGAPRTLVIQAPNGFGAILIRATERSIHLANSFAGGLLLSPGQQAHDYCNGEQHRDCNANIEASQNPGSVPGGVPWPWGGAFFAASIDSAYCRRCGVSMFGFNHAPHI
jgi:hypothetical protein